MFDHFAQGPTIRKIRACKWGNSGQLSEQDLVFVARRMQDSQVFPGPNMTMFFAEAYHLYLIDPLVDSYGFCTTAIAVGLFFGCSGDHRTSERLARASKLWNVVVTCLLEMVVVPGDGIHQPPMRQRNMETIGHPKLTGYLMTSPTILYIWQLLGFWSDRPFQNRVPQNASVQNPMDHSKSDWHIAKNDQDLASLDIPGLKNDSCAIHKNKPSPIDQPFGGYIIASSISYMAWGASLEHRFKRHYEGVMAWWNGML